MKKLLGRYMVKSPYVVEPSMLAGEALETMRELEIRHLPVVEENELVGLVSERDLTIAVAKRAETKIREVMAKDLYTVSPASPVSEVIGQMIDLKVGSALVVSEEDEIIGIFTTIDALRLLYEMLDGEDEDLTLDDYFEDWSELQI